MSPARSLFPQGGREDGGGQGERKGERKHVRIGDAEDACIKRNVFKKYPKEKHFRVALGRTRTAM